MWQVVESCATQNCLFSFSSADMLQPQISWTAADDTFNVITGRLYKHPYSYMWPW